MLRADILMARKLYPEAIAAYQAILKQEPRNAVLLNKIGIAYHQQALLRDAEGYYKRAVKADKTYSSAINNLGTIQYERRKFRRAIRLYDRALKLRQDEPAVYSNLGYAYFAEKQYDAALAAFQQALRIDPLVFEHRGGVGVLVQQRSATDPAKLYFFLAKSYALAGDAGHCAHYLKMARDEGYKELGQARTDPAFARVLADPRVREILEPNPPMAEVPQRSPGP